MTTFEWKKLVRAVRVLGTILALTLFGALVADDIHQRDQVATFVLAQKKNRPITEFNTGALLHLDCVKAYEVRFFADIADASTAADPDARAAGRTKLEADRDDLRATFTKLCPSPSPPAFDDQGNLTTPPVTHPQVLPPPPPEMPTTTTTPGG